MNPDNSDMPKSRAQQTVPIAVAVVLALVALLLGGGGGYLIASSAQKARDPIAETPTVTPTVIPTTSEEGNGEPTPVPTDTQAPGTNAQTPANPAYTLKVGKSNLSVPQGWYVSRIGAYSQDFTKEEKANLLKTEGQQDGYYPIFTGAVLTLQKGSSVISFEKSSSFIAGGFGFVPEELGKDWTVVVTPTASKKGYARKLVSGTYQYQKITICDTPEMCGKYAIEMGLSPLRMTFAGSSQDLAVADSLFSKYVVDSTLDFGAKK